MNDRRRGMQVMTKRAENDGKVRLYVIIRSITR